jgi:hypothetical protein
MSTGANLQKTGTVMISHHDGLMAGVQWKTIKYAYPQGASCGGGLRVPPQGFNEPLISVDA